MKKRPIGVLKIRFFSGDEVEITGVGAERIPDGRIERTLSRIYIFLGEARLRAIAEMKRSETHGR